MNDEILKALLQRSWSAAPANIHYQVHFSRDAEIELRTMHSIADANFRVLNLVTLFLGNEGTKSLFELISMSESSFEAFADRVGARTKYVYYLTGAVGTGKTTTVNQFKNFWAMDEWLEKSPDIVSKPFDTLTDSERKDADNWVGSQFHQKNLRLHRERESVVMIDRCPLDPLTFAEGDVSDRANLLDGQISPSPDSKGIADGMVFVLEAAPAELRVRLVRKWKFWDEKTIEKLISKIKTIYADDPIYVDTVGLTLSEVVRLIVKRIFFEDYVPLSLANLLEKIRSPKK